MLYSALKTALSSIVTTGWPTTLAENTEYDVVPFGGAVPVTIGGIENALVAEMPGAPITALMNAVPSELTAIATELLGNVTIAQLSVKTGLADGSDFDIRNFTITLAAASPSTTLCGLTITGYGLQLNFAVIGGTLVFSPSVYATVSFLNVECGLDVGIYQPSLTIALSQGDSSTINSILGGASSGTSIASLSSSMNLSLTESAVTLDYFVAQAALSSAPSFNCAIALDFGASTASWGTFTLESLAFTFSHGGGDTTFGATVVAEIGGFEVDCEIAYDSASASATLSGACPAIGVTLPAFWDAISGDLSVSNPVDMLDDVYLNNIAVSLTRASGQTSFEIHCGGTIVSDALGAPLTFDFGFTSAGGGDVDVTLKLNDIEFDLVKTASTMVFSFEGPGTLPLATLVEAAQLNALAGLVNELDLTLDGADLVIVKNGTTNTNSTLFAAQLSFNATVQSDLLTMITGADAIGCTGATLFAASTPWTLDQINAVSGRSVTISGPVPQGVSGIPVLVLGSLSAALPLAPPTTSNTTSSSGQPPQPYGGVASTAGTWFDIQKQFGPVYLNRIGFAFDKGADGTDIELMADGSFTIGPLTVALSGFEVDIPYEHLSDVSVSLHGLSVAYNKPPLVIEGGFLVAGNDTYLGELTVKTETFLIGAIGEYARQNGHTSLAIFAALTDPPLGGPIYCFIEGLAAGFGYNSQLNIPAQASDVPNFALVQVASGGIPPTNPFGIIQACMSPKEGDDWIALGLIFRSFEMIESTVLLTAEFGNDLQFAILGQSEMSLPPASPERIAYAQLDVEALFIPSQELVSVSGVLTPNSYVLSQDCHIQGGFIYLLKGSGEFIVSYGGYAPGFDYKSLGYPAVPRIGLSWQIDSHTYIKGDLYYAMTPAAMMAGGGLHASWDCGIFSAWFDVTMDILIQWRPFHYQADFSMSLGVNFDLTVAFIHVHFTFHIGADLTIHGPPFGGHAHIDLDVVSFDIDFGADNSAPKPLDWTDFRTMLPGNAANDAGTSSLLSTTVTDGLVKDFSAPTPKSGARLGDSETPNWSVNGTHFAFTIQSSLPITLASSGNVSVNEAPLPAAIGVLPMQLGTASGMLDVVIIGPNGLVTASSDPEAEISVAMVNTKGAPALWGQSQASDSNAPPLEMTTGYVIKGGLKPSPETMVLDLAALLDEEIMVQAISDRAASANPFN